MDLSQLRLKLEPKKVEEPPKVLDSIEQVAHDCFWQCHLKGCDCEVNWWIWEKATGRSIWEIA